MYYTKSFRAHTLAHGYLQLRAQKKEGKLLWEAAWGLGAAWELRGPAQMVVYFSAEHLACLPAVGRGFGAVPSVTSSEWYRQTRTHLLKSELVVYDYGLPEKHQGTQGVRYITQRIFAAPKGQGRSDLFSKENLRFSPPPTPSKQLDLLLASGPTSLRRSLRLVSKLPAGPVPQPSPSSRPSVCETPTQPTSVPRSGLSNVSRLASVSRV